MQDELILNGKRIKMDVLQVVDDNHRYLNEHIVAINATDLIFSPEIAAQLRSYIGATYPDLKTIYYRISGDGSSNWHFSPVMEDSSESTPQINVSPQELKKYEQTLELLNRK